MDILGRITSLLYQFGISGNILRWIFVAVALFALIFILYQLYKKFGGKKAKKSAPSEEKPPESEQPKKEEPDKLTPQLKKAFADFLKKLRLHVVGRTLRPQVRGRNYLHQIPWFMIIGETDSGKSTLLSHTGLNLPLRAPKPSEHGFDAWFFEHGIMLDIKGQYVLRPEQVGSTGTNRHSWSEEKGWQTLLRLLRQHRSYCPIDGLILTIPCTDLLASQAQGETEHLSQKAEYLYHKLWQAQKTLGIRFPVYILVTKCDVLEGFTHFCSILPEQLRQNIFGWSNPEDLYTVYEPTVPHRAFQKIYRDLNELQVELVTALSHIQEVDQCLLFPHQFRPLFKQLKIYLDILFQTNVYHEPFFLRGIYFCGDAKGGTQIISHQSSAISDQIDFESRLEEQPREKQLLFLMHLFKHKIFPESDLARPVMEVLYEQKRQLRIKQAIAAVLFLSWSLGQWWQYNQLTQNKKPVLELLEGVDNHLRLLEVAAEKQVQQIAGAEHLLQNISKLPQENFVVLSLPHSWISELDDKIAKCLALGYENFVLRWMHDKLDRKARDLTFRTKIDPNDSQRNEQSTLEVLRSFIDQFAELEKKVEDYNHINEQKDSNKIKELIEYLDKSVQFSSLLSKKILTNVHEQVKVKEYLSLPTIIAPHARRIVQELTDQWLTKRFKQGQLLNHVKQLQRRLNKLYQIYINMERGQWSEAHRWIEEDFFGLISLINQIEQKLTDDLLKWAWISKQEIQFNWSPFGLLEPISASTSLSSLEKNLQKMGDQHFKAFHDDLLSLKHPFTDQARAPILEEQEVKKESRAENLPPPVSEAENESAQTSEQKPLPSSTIMIQRVTVLELSPTLLELRSYLKELQNKDFMLKMKTGRQQNVLRDFPRNSEILQTAIDLYHSFSKYNEEALTKLPPVLDNLKIKGLFYQVGTVRLYNNMKHLVIKAQQPETGFKTINPNLSYRLQNEQALLEKLEKFARAADLLRQILGQLKQLRGNKDASDNTIKLLMVNEAAQLLVEVDSLLEYDLYRPKYEIPEHWDGAQPPLTEVLFGYKDLTETETKLGWHHERIETLAYLYAKPLINLIQQGHDDDEQKSLEGLTVLNQGQKDIFLKWDQIITILDNYNKEKVDNSLKKLEDFILFGLNKVSLDNCPKEPITKGDFFSKKHHDLQKLVVAYCQKSEEDQRLSEAERLHTQDEEIRQRYRGLQHTFNETLAGCFPFSTHPPTLVESSPLLQEANPKQIKDFFLEYHQEFRDELTSAIQTQLTGPKHRLIEFLEQLSQVDAFFQASWLQEQSPQLILPVQRPLFDFDVEFRVNRPKEQGANQIIDWKIAVGSQVLQYPNGEASHQKIRWQSGDPIKVSFRWARNSPFRPYQSRENPNPVMTVSGQTAIFEYRSHWALFELLLWQSPQAADFPYLKDLRPHTVKFIIPVNRLRENIRLLHAQKLNDQTEVPPVKAQDLPRNQTDYEPPEPDHDCLGRWKQGSPRNFRWKRDCLQERHQPPREQKPPIEEQPPAVIPYQYQNHEQFEEPWEPTVVFLRLMLFKPDQEKPEPMIVPLFPSVAPQFEAEPQPTNYACPIYSFSEFNTPSIEDYQPITPNTPF